MTNKTKERALAVIGLLFIVAATYGGYVLLRYIAGLLLAIDQQVAASIIVASGTVLAAVGVALYSQRRTKEREIAEAHRPQKIEITRVSWSQSAMCLKEPKMRRQTILLMPSLESI